MKNRFKGLVVLLLVFILGLSTLTVFANENGTKELQETFQTIQDRFGRPFMHSPGWRFESKEEAIERHREILEERIAQGLMTKEEAEELLLRMEERRRTCHDFEEDLSYRRGSRRMWFQP